MSIKSGSSGASRPPTPFSRPVTAAVIVRPKTTTISERAELRMEEGGEADLFDAPEGKPSAKEGGTREGAAVEVPSDRQTAPEMTGELVEDINTMRAAGANIDDDNDGILDINDPDHESNKDPDGDGLTNDIDNDDDGDGILDSEDPDHPSNIDSDGDGLTNDVDNDDDGDGILDINDPNHESNIDSDGDGIKDDVDNDDDGDGILDVDDVDHPSNVDTDNDGLTDDIDTDDPESCHDQSPALSRLMSSPTSSRN